MEEQENHSTTEELSELEKLQQELQEFKNKYLLVLAESENLRKRMQKEKIDATRFAIENAISEILHPLDNLENALKFTDQMSDDTRNWAQGFQMILSQFKDMLNNNGVIAFHSEGNFFDPHLHEAVEVMETEEHPDGTIVKEFLKGYKCGDRTLRAARVKVAKAPQSEEVQPSEEELKQ